MDLRCRQTQMRLPWASNPSGWYYWTNTLYFDLDNPPSGNTSSNIIGNGIRFLHMDFVQRHNFRIGVPPEPIAWGSPLNGFDAPGLIGQESGYSPFDTAKLVFKAGGVPVGYMRLRCPVQASDQVGGLLHPDLRNDLEANANFYFLSAKICSREGVPIDEVYVSPRVHGWQFRDGTKRRERLLFT